MTVDVPLDGCSAEPLSNYLKALGVLRLVSEQADAEARGYWKTGIFILQSKFNLDELVDFFLSKYAPTPLISPWNKAAGFIKKNNTTRVLDEILESTDLRLNAFSETVECARKVVKAAREDGLPLDKISAKEGEDTKRKLVVRLRNALPDAGLVWIDAALVITSSKRGWKPFPLLGGGGGNDGRAEFSVTFIEQLGKIIAPLTNGRNRQNLLNALFGTETNGLGKSVFGQFNPAAVGNFNASNGFTSENHTNPWDYVLAMEGALVFSGAAVKRYKGEVSDSSTAFPFTVRPSKSGYGTATEGEKIRSEMWIPTWGKPASAAEIKYLFSEGRAEFDKHGAKNSLEFAQATASLGVDRGIEKFHRYAFIERNGTAHFAVKCDSFDAREKRDAGLLREPIKWLARNWKKRNSKNDGNSFRETEENIFRLSHNGFEKPAEVQGLITSFGRVVQNQAHAKTEAWSFPSVLDGNWLEKADDSSSEFRLAASLASLLYFDRVRLGRRGLWGAEFNKRLGLSIDSVRFLNAVMADRILRLSQGKHERFREETARFARLEDVSAFLEGRLDDKKIVALLFGLLFLKWDKVKNQEREVRYRGFPGAGYALTKLCFTGVKLGGNSVPLVPAIHKRMASNDGVKALKLATWRLRASGFMVPNYDELSVPPGQCERLAAALLFPLGSEDIEFLQERVLETGR